MVCDMVLMSFGKTVIYIFATLHPGEVGGYTVGRNSFNTLAPYNGGSVIGGVII